jgi:fatty-acid peroxygenase
VTRPPTEARVQRPVGVGVARRSSRRLGLSIIIPRDRTFDGTLALLGDPYRFIATRCRRNGSDAFVTRLMLRRVTCVVGEEGSRMFYTPDRFTRRAALPITALTLLQDRGSALTLDAEAHRHRKQMLRSIMTPASVGALVDPVEEELVRRARRWESKKVVVLVPELQAVRAGGATLLPVLSDGRRARTRALRLARGAVQDRRPGAARRPWNGSRSALVGERTNSAPYAT